jgi:hypothetical protein
MPVTKRYDAFLIDRPLDHEKFDDKRYHPHICSLNVMRNPMTIIATYPQEPEKRPSKQLRLDSGLALLPTRVHGAHLGVYTSHT